jgi:uncharacterized protein (DUF1330 family)
MACDKYRAIWQRIIKTRHKAGATLCCINNLARKIMSAYFIVFVEKPAAQSEIDEYRRLALPTFEGKEVKFHTRPGCELLTVEGDDVNVVVIIEFKSMQEAKDWYRSPGYQKALKHRLGTARSRAVIIEKLPQ